MTFTAAPAAASTSAMPITTGLTGIAYTDTTAANGTTYYCKVTMAGSMTSE